jgi:hypothetical protein
MDTVTVSRRMQSSVLSIEEIESEADFILYTAGGEVLSEHCTESEARLAFYKEAAQKGLGERLPIIYGRQEPNWVPLN